MVSFIPLQFTHSVVSDSLWPHGLQHARPPCPSANSWRLIILTSIRLVMPSNYLILCCPLLSQPSIFPSIRVFSNESLIRIRWPKYWSLNFSIGPSNEETGLISFRMEWLCLVTVFVDWDLGTGVNKKRDAGDPSLEWNKGVLFEDIHVYVSSYKAAIGSKKKKKKKTWAKTKQKQITIFKGTENIQYLELRGA